MSQTDTARATAPAAASAGMLALRWTDAPSTPELTATRTVAEASTSALGYVVLNAWDHEKIAAIRAAHPGVKVLVYKDASATVEYAQHRDADGEMRDNELLPAGVGYHWAMRNAPSWFLRDAGGNAIEWADYRRVWPMDIGNADYQRAWLDNTLTELRAYGWDGVMLDDVLTTLSHPHVGGAVAVQIPDDAAMYAATASFLGAVGSGLRSAGYVAVPNLTLSWKNWKTTLADWGPFVSGWEIEYFVKWGLTSEHPRMIGNEWVWRLELVELSQSLGKFVLPVTYGSAVDTELQTYHRGTWLLAWDGKGGASVFTPSETTASHWLPAAQTDLGMPIGERQALGGGAWRREYSRGTVIVNPSAVVVTVPLAGERVTQSGTTVTSVTLQPASAQLLRLPSPAPTATSPTADPTTSPTATPIPSPSTTAPASAPATSPSPSPKKGKGKPPRSG